MPPTIDEYARDPAGFEIALATDLEYGTRYLLDAAQTAETPIFYSNEEDVLSRGRIAQVARYASYDIDRSHIEQDAEMSLSKYVAYIVYWFARLKPIRPVYRQWGGKDVEILDINERVALQLIQWLVLRITCNNSKLAPRHWRECQAFPLCRQPDGQRAMGKCFFDAFTTFLYADGLRHANQMVYSQRFSTVGPQSFVTIIDQALFYACPERIRHR
jgi:hypothetical protein